MELTALMQDVVEENQADVIKWACRIFPPYVGVGVWVEEETDESTSGVGGTHVREALLCEIM